MVVAPGELGMALDTLTLLRRLHPDAPIWIRDDATGDGTGDALAGWAEKDGNTDFERNARPLGYLGACRTIFTLFATVARDPRFDSCDFLVKLDPDCLIASTGYAEAVGRLFASAGPGLVGAVTLHPSGGTRDIRRQALDLRLDLLPIGPAKVNGPLRVRRPYWARALRSARANGYVLGTCVQGGGYAIHRETLRELDRRGFWDMPENYSGRTFQEDTIVAVGITSLGHALHEYADSDMTWWVQYRPPVPISPEQARSGGYAIVHPLKDDDQGWALRAALAGAGQE